MTTVLDVQGLDKGFGEGEGRREVIRGLDLQVEAGRFEAVMGASGAGKSTLLHLLAGLIPADGGRIAVDGQDLGALGDAEMSVFRRRRIGLVFQDYNLIPTLTVEENVELPFLLDRRRADEAEVGRLLGALGLEGVRKRLPEGLSGGERQRAAIARALARRPAIVLADEPTGNLDSPAAKAFCGMLRRLNGESGCTILMVSHDPVVSAAADRVHLLRDGRFVDSFATCGNAERVAERYLTAMRG